MVRNLSSIFRSFIEQIFIEHLLLARHHSRHKEYSSEHDRQVSGAHKKILKSQREKRLKSFHGYPTTRTCPSVLALPRDRPCQSWVNT